MLLFLIHLVVRRLLRVIVGSSAVAALEVENAVLRHQLCVLRRTAKRVGAQTRFRLQVHEFADWNGLYAPDRDAMLDRHRSLGLGLERG